MGTNESFDVQNTSLLMFASVVDKCTDYCFRFIQKFDNLWRSPCVRLNFEPFTANMTQ